MTWQTLAACGSDDWPKLTSEDSAVQREAAARLCPGCPVVLDCLQFGISNREDYVYGGLTRRQREVYVITVGPDAAQVLAYHRDSAQRKRRKAEAKRLAA